MTIEGEQAADDDSVVQQLLGLLQAKLQGLEEALAAERQLHQQVHRHT